MTVAELIEVLSKMPQDAEVYSWAHDYGGDAYIARVHSIEHDEWQNRVQIEGE